jgi:hypothetical protein
MTAYNIPATIKVKASNFGLVFNTRKFTSPFNQATQTIELTGARWKATYTTPPLSYAQAAAIKAFLVKLRGGANTFNAYDPDGKTARGTPTGTPLVNGGSQTGNSLIIDGCTPNITGWLKEGDYFAVNGELKMIIADVNSNGSGEATLTFEPSLRASPANNAPITVSSATCEMMLMSDDEAQWDSDENKVTRITFSGIEKLT